MTSSVQKRLCHAGMLLFLGLGISIAQQEYPSIHQVESEAHDRDELSLPATDIHRAIPLMKRSTALTKKVLGWHPYWASSTAHQSYDYAALSHIAYFSYEVDTATGGYKTVRSWLGTPIIDYAHARGTKVLLTVTCFGTASNAALLSDTNKQNTLIASLISLLLQRNGDGVNFDLESVPNSQRLNLTAFMQKASARIKASIPAAEISMASPAVDWSSAPKTWDFAALAQVCDYLIVMGYDYYYSGSTTAGPVAPLTGENYTITKSVDTYLASGMPPERLWLGVPWFGYDWPVTSDARKASATASGTSRTYIATRSMAGLPNRIFDPTTQVPYFSYLSGSTWRQVWYDDSTSLAAKYALTRTKNLGGIGIWALSYESGRKEIWGGIKSAFDPTTVVIDETHRPIDIVLHQNFPNPFNPATTIQFSLPAEGRVRLTVTDILGRTVATLIDGRMQQGTRTVQFDASGLPSGVYLYHLHTEFGNRTGRMMFLK